jgi:dipeptide transport system substrate-binding protein
MRRRCRSTTGLVEFEIGTTNIVPGWPRAGPPRPDGLTYTFRLRKGVKFHSNAKFTPTREFNADDVLFSYNRQADPNHPYAKVTPGQTYAYFEDMGMKDIVERVEKVDPMTVRFVLKKPEAPFMADMAMDFASILSAEYADKMMAAKTPDVVDKEPIGTGPFQFVSYQKDAVIRYKAFDEHWNGRPKIDNLVYAITTDASVRYAEAEDRRVPRDGVPEAGRRGADEERPEHQPGVAAGPERRLHRLQRREEAVRLEAGAAGAEHGGEQEGDPRLGVPGRRADRQEPDPADALGIQRPDRRLSLRPGEGEGAVGPGRLSERHRGRALVLAGDPPVQPDGKRMAELIQADWEKVGVKTKLITYEWGEYRKRSKTGEQHAMMFGWSGDNGDPDNFFVPLLGCAAVKGGGNVARWCDKDFENLLQMAKLATRQTDRAGFYAKAQVIAHEEAPWITIAHSVRFDPVRRK